MTEMFGEAWSPMSVPDLAPDDDDDSILEDSTLKRIKQKKKKKTTKKVSAGWNCLEF